MSSKYCNNTCKLEENTQEDETLHSNVRASTNAISLVHTGGGAVETGCKRHGHDRRIFSATLKNEHVRKALVTAGMQ